jgi:Xaa-Pro aminopeptidase
MPIGRPIYTGEPPVRIERAMTWAVVAQSMCREALRPGAVGRDVEGAGRGFIEEKGLGKYFVYAGIHSVGLVEFEPPIMSPKSEDVIQQDMILSIDIPLFLTPWGGLRYEDGFRVTKKGAVSLDHVRTGVLSTSR